MPPETGFRFAQFPRVAEQPLDFAFAQNTRADAGFQNNIQFETGSGRGP